VRPDAVDRGEDRAMVDEEERALYSVRPEDFVEARNALARSWRKAGRRDDAARVAKLRRPSPTAWSLNQVARNEPTLVEALLDAGARLRVAMQRAVQGDAGDVRSAQAVERAAVETITTAARQYLGQPPRSADVVGQRIANMLRAAVLDDKIAQQLRDGMLDIDVESSGFGLGDLTDDEVPPPPPTHRARAVRSRPARSGDATTNAAAKAEADAAAATAAKAESERRAAAAVLAAEAERLGAVADDAESEVEAMVAQITQLQDRLRTAKDEARRARRAADDARRVATKAQGVTRHTTG